MFGHVMRILLYYALLLLVVALAFWRGRLDEKWAACTCVVGTVLTAATSYALGDRWGDFDLFLFVVDAAVFLSFLFIALRSERFWPMWVAGLQLTATSVHLLKLINPELMRFVFGAALAFWSYPILALIAVGAWRTTLVEHWRSQSIAWDGPTQ